MSPHIADVLLAAGASRRFGGKKLLAVCGGETLIQRAASLTRNTAVRTRLAVLGEVEAKLIGTAADAAMGIAINSHWRRGQGASVAAGVSALSEDCDAVLIRLADQVLITREDIDTLIDTWRAAPDAIVTARYNDILGVPAVFPRRCFEALSLLDGDRGARRIIAADEQVVAVDLPHAAVDIDTREDLARAESALISRARERHSARN